MKKSKKKAAPKKSKKKETASKHEIVVRVEAPQTLTAIRESDLEPVKEGGKYMIPKTWISEKQALKIIQKTPPQYILKRKGKGNQNFDYIPGHYFKRVLNYTFGWNWDFKIVKQEVFGVIGKDKWAQVVTTGELTVKDDNGHQITKGDNGKADIKYMKDSFVPMDIGNDFKSSATDCLKRCASQLGIGSDVYGKVEIKHDSGMEVAPDRPTPVQGRQEDHSHKEPVIQRGNDVPEDYVCLGKGCGVDIKKAEAEFSKKMFGKHLCRNCQKLARDNK